MAKPTQEQLIALEKDPGYREFVRMAVLTVCYYWKGINGTNNGEGYTVPADAENWFKKRQLAEDLLGAPQQSIQVDYWASRTIKDLKDMDIPGVDENTSTAAIIVILNTPLNAPQNMGTRFGTLAEGAYNEESKKKPF